MKKIINLLHKLSYKSEYMEIHEQSGLYKYINYNNYKKIEIYLDCERNEIFLNTQNENMFFSKNEYDIFLEKFIYLHRSELRIIKIKKLLNEDNK